MLIVIDGRMGNGMCVSIDPKKPNALDMAHGGGLAQILRNMADAIEAGERPAGVGLTTYDPVGEA